MDRAKVKMIRDEMTNALNEMGARHGLSFDLGTITFTDTDFSVKVRGIDHDVTTAGSALELDWNKNKARYPELAGVVLGQRFRNDKGDVYRIVGLKPRNRKYPVIANRVSDGKGYKFSPYAISIYIKNTL